MKVDELMIGDWVQVNKDVCIKRGTVVRVRSIDADNSFPKKGLKGCVTYAPIDNMTFVGGVWVEYLIPILLTPQILEKNGFTRSRVFVEWKYNKDDTYILWKPFPWVRITREESDVCFTCEYVHELQHALRLCGLTEIADQFKV